MPRSRLVVLIRSSLPGGRPRPANDLLTDIRAPADATYRDEETWAIALAFTAISLPDGHAAARNMLRLATVALAQTPQDTFLTG